MTRERARAFTNLKYAVPRSLLLELRRLELLLPSDVSPSVRNLRTNQLKPLRELREAALFCYGWEQIDGQALGVALVEAQDYDAVATWQSDTELHFAPIQIKEVVPENLNPTMTVQDVINGLQKYVDSDDLTVVIHLNRTVSGFAPLELVIPPLKIGALWILAAVTADQSRWFLWGNFLETIRWGEFSYPGRESHPSSGCVGA
jgi:hypothetical protein